MNFERAAFALLMDAVTIAALTALIARGRWRLCLAFVPYLLCVLTFNLSIVLWPERFYKAWFWMAGHAVFDALRMAIALEIAWRVFRQARSPTARIVALYWIGLIALATMLMRVFEPRSSWFWTRGDLWTLWATVALAAVLRLRPDRFHIALASSFAVYLSLTAVPWVVEFVQQSAPRAGSVLGAEPIAYLTLMCWWVYISLRRPSSSDTTGGVAGVPSGASAADQEQERRPPPPNRLAVGVAGV